MQKGVSNSRLVRQLLVLLVMAALLLSGCGAAFPVYPGAKSDNSFEGSVASLSCFSSNNLIGAPGEKVEISPQIYSTADSLDTVKAWYKQNLTEWSEAGATCENGTTYVFPKECDATPEPCEKQLNIIEKDSGGTWIVVFIP
jgi:hypothetical protein